MCVMFFSFVRSPSAPLRAVGAGCSDDHRHGLCTLGTKWASRRPPCRLPPANRPAHSARTFTSSIPACRKARSRQPSTRWQTNKSPTSSELSAMRCCLSPAPMDPAPPHSIFSSATTPPWRASAAHRATSSSTGPSMCTTSASAVTASRSITSGDRCRT